VLQLGEDPERVFCVGSLGVDGILNTELMSRKELEQDLGFRFGKRNLLVTFHPVTLESDTSEKQIKALLQACRRMSPDVHFIFTMPNSDTHGRVIINRISEFVDELGERAMAATSLGRLRYWSVMKHVDVVVGNSSSGLLEAPTLKVATVNIGDRQKGRLIADSVINCAPSSESIDLAIRKALSASFRKVVRDTVNPLGEGGAAQAIFDMLPNVEIGEDLLKKTFHTVGQGTKDSPGL
jgi:GDP/UDP-N,N'-diacetylbacillosamine 2-epimerase (hydrolysing)